MTNPLMLDCIEVHAAGEPGRVVTNVAHLVEGDTMAERFDYCRENLQWLRRLLLREPRGYPALCAVLLLPATNPGSDFGMVVLEQGGFTPMSGSNTMCAVTAAIETGLVAAVEPTTQVTIDTAVGTVTALATVRAGKVQSVTVSNVPAFVVALDSVLDVPEFGPVRADIVFGGQFFVQAKASDFGVDLDPAWGRELVRVGALLKLAAQEQVSVQHPLNKAINAITLVMLHSGPRVVGADSHNTVVLTQGLLDANRPETWTGTLDRSPCGTGTCGRMAALHARGDLALGEEFVHRSVIGTKFVGRLTGTTDVAGRAAVLPTITGQAWVTGRSQWMLGPTDPFREGYTVADIWAPNLD